MLINKAGYTNRLKSRVLGRSSNVEGRGIGGPVYTTASVACDRAGAVMNKPLAKCRKH